MGIPLTPTDPLTLTLSPEGRGDYMLPLPSGERAGVRGLIRVRGLNREPYA